jgi:hypothetical protein
MLHVGLGLFAAHLYLLSAQWRWRDSGESSVPKSLKCLLMRQQPL